MLAIQDNTKSLPWRNEDTGKQKLLAGLSAPVPAETTKTGDHRETHLLSQNEIALTQQKQMKGGDAARDTEEAAEHGRHVCFVCVSVCVCEPGKGISRGLRSGAAVRVN